MAPDRFITITFDDGPFDHSDRLLGILAEHDVRATFFLIGGNINARLWQAKRMSEAGHDVANHSWGWSSLGTPSPGVDAIRKSLGDTSALIKEATGKPPAFFRAPNLNLGADLEMVAGEMGMSIIGATANSHDWRDIPTAEIVNNALYSVKDGGIILLHEFHSGSRRTEWAVPEIICSLRARGFAIVPLSKLVEIKGATLEPGAIFNSIN